MIKPYYQDDYCTIYNCDCREILPELDKVDLVLTDPPYMLNDVTGGKPECDPFSHKWQGMLKSSDATAGIAQMPMDVWMPLIADSVGEGGEFYVMCNDKNLRRFLNGFSDNGIRLHNVLVWHKPNATPNRWYMKNAEFCLYGFKSPAKKITDMGSKTCNHYEHDEKQHPTQKPLEWMRLMVFNSRGTILDPFMGSGTTLRAAKDLQRKCIGIELEEKYCEIAVKRLSQEVLAL